jgi:hypothetical protein
MPKLIDVQDNKRKIKEVSAKLKPLTIGEKIDKLHQLREAKRVLTKQIEELEAEFDGMKESVLVDLDGQHLDQGRGKLASCTVKIITVPNVQDWDKVFAYVHKTKHFHLFERRVSSSAFQELLELNGEKKMLDAGIAPFKKKNLNLRNL